VSRYSAVRLAVLLFVLVPIVDLFILVQIAAHVGVWPVLGFVAATALLAALLARREGRRVLHDVEEARRAGGIPREGLASAALRSVARLLLVLPGLLSTVAGLALLVPAVRRLIGHAARGWLERRLADATVTYDVPSAEDDGAERPVIDLDDRGRPVR
jgi:UPF0716 protein FxsA